MNKTNIIKNAAPNIYEGLSPKEIIPPKYALLFPVANGANSSDTVIPLFWIVAILSFLAKQFKSSPKYDKNGIKNQRFNKDVYITILDKYIKVFFCITLRIPIIQSNIIKNASISHEIKWLWINPLNPITGAINACQNPSAINGRNIIAEYSPKDALI